MRTITLRQQTRNTLTLAVGLVAAAAVVACAASVTPAAAARTVTAVTASCPVTGSGPYVKCIHSPNSSKPNVGLQITDGSGSDPGTPFQVTDHSGAPMAWVNLFGLYSGGDGGLEPGGLVCVTYSVTSTAACLTPEGDLQLQATGPKGPTGPVETLTPADITELHQIEAAHVTMADLKWLATHG